VLAASTRAIDAPDIITTRARKSMADFHLFSLCVDARALGKTRMRIFQSKRISVAVTHHWLRVSDEQILDAM
jgi:hypothetical protein